MYGVIGKSWWISSTDQHGTPLVRLARERGVLCVDGFDVLVDQGAASFRLWTGREAPLEGFENWRKKRKDILSRIHRC